MNIDLHPSAVVTDTTNSSNAKLKPVSVNAVKLNDGFWEPRRKINRNSTLPTQFKLCEETGRLDNFRRASGKKALPFQGIFFNDSDIYKWLEAVSWALAENDDEQLADMANTAISEIGDAQQPDGYLNTYFMLEHAGERWSNLKDMHELYCAGHLFQAAVAHYRATGSDRLLNIARRYADYIDSVFGPEEEGKRPGTGGHEEIEMALVEMCRATGQTRYLKLAKYFIDARGRGLIGGSSYHQDHKPFREMDRMIGHAVRQVYLNCGATDVLAETGEEALRTALDRLWENMTTKQMYVSGGIGSRHEGEAFGNDYELPNERAYTETCAAIGSAMWAWRMLGVTADARYADIMEWQLYNAVMPGLSLDGQTYFYENPLADDGNHRRQPWFGCACCPPNVARTLAALPGYFYSVSEDAVWMHLYATNNAIIEMPWGHTIEIRAETKYPWDGKVTLEIKAEGQFSINFRIPSWCETGALLNVNGSMVFTDLVPGTYATVKRIWHSGDSVELLLPMPIRTIECHPYVFENSGRVALTRGPILYCAEQADNPENDPRNIAVNPAVLSASYNPSLLGGVISLRGEGLSIEPDANWEDKLYRTVKRADDTNHKTITVTAIPYCAWANREAGPMQVWLKRL